MMKVVGEEGTSLTDYIDYLKGEFFDFVYLQQNAFDEVDESTTAERQKCIFGFIYHILETEFDFEDKGKALHFFHKLRQRFRSWNSAKWESGEFEKIENEISALVEEAHKKKERESVA